LGKAKELLTVIPGRLNLPYGAVKRMEKTFEMLFDYEKKEKGAEFKRIGNSMKDCEDRLDVVFNMIDGAVTKYEGDAEAAKEGKKLLLLASTPEPVAQQEILSTYGESNDSFSDVVSVVAAKEIGSTRGFWN